MSVATATADDERAIIAYKIGGWVARWLPIAAFGLLLVEECWKLWRAPERPKWASVPPKSHKRSELEWFCDQYTFMIEQNEGDSLPEEEGALVWFRHARAVAPAGHPIRAVPEVDGLALDPAY